MRPILAVSEADYLGSRLLGPDGPATKFRAWPNTTGSSNHRPIEIL